MEKDTPKKQKAPQKPGRLIYCGPNLPGGLLQQHTIYKGGTPKHLDNVIEKCPAFKALFVEPARLTETMIDVNTPGTVKNLLYQEVKEFIAKGGLKQ